MKHLFRGFALVVLAIGLLVAAGRLRVEPVLTGSMAPAFPVGTLVAVSPVKDVHVGEVIMFVPPAPYAQNRVLHRVVSTSGGVRTKGDANPVMDPWVLSSRGLWRLRWASPEVGRMMVIGRTTLHGAGLLLWPGLLLLWLSRKPVRRSQHTYVSRHGTSRRSVTS